jgi:ADP-ribose pyrophosphatase YjhB (NUDIX family)
VTTQDEHFRRVAQSGAIRPSVRAICLRGDTILAQQPADDPSSCFAFVGGRLEVGDTFEGRIRVELDEELGSTVTRVEYLFVVENRFRVPEGLVHCVEHFLHVDIADGEVRTREPHLTHHWLPLAQLPVVDLRPRVVRDALIDGSWTTVRHLLVPFDG